MNYLLAATFLPGLSLGGAAAEALGGFFSLAAGGVTIGGILGGLFGLVRERRGRRDQTPWSRPTADWQRFGAIGGIIGGVIGLVLALADALLGG